MLHRFPPAPADAGGPSFLTGKADVFAKLKIESVAGQRTVLMTGHTLIFVQKGAKLLHFTEGTVRVNPGEIFLLRKGIYVMAEYIDDGLDFEALMIFLPDRLLRKMAEHASVRVPDQQAPYLVFPSTPLINAFRNSFRTYFDHRPAGLEQLLPLRLQEIMHLLLDGPQGEKVGAFIRAAISEEPAHMDYIIQQYLFKPVSIEELADLCNCSLAKFKRDFQQRYQTSPRSWITRQRLVHAHMLLLRTSRQVADVALDCGFESTSHFIRLYKSRYGATPTAARAKMTIE